MKKWTKRQEAIYDAWVASPHTKLSDVYASWSSKKQASYDNCRELYWKQNGEDFTIISANRYMFTVGWMWKRDDGTVMFHYATRNPNDSEKPKHEDWEVEHPSEWWAKK